MGWKSTINITREEAIEAIEEQMITLHDKTDSELVDMLEGYGFGDNSELKWYGHNFIVDDE